MSLSIGIVICTYHRPELLQKCLKSVLQQPAQDGVEVTVYVVDNSEDASARAQVEDVAEGAEFPVRWLTAQPSNISVARNAAVAATDEPILAFIDDDNCCQAGWLEAVVAAVREDDADVWFGAIATEFEAGSEPTPAVHNLFARSSTLDPGAPLYAFGPGKAGSVTLTTNNAVFRRATAFVDAEPFDLAFGQGGGEDYDLFCRLQRRGGRFAWLPAAVVTEFVPRRRCDSVYLRERFFAGGQAFAAAFSGTGPDALRKRWTVRARALVQAGLLSLKLPLAVFGGPAKLQDYSYLWAGVLGKLSFGDIHPIYRIHSAPTAGAGEQDTQKAA